MEIQELILKNFGKFAEKHIRLEPGINVLYGENESGKSTIHTFIRGMLFGMERGRGRAAVYDTYSVYEPWENPNYYSGSLRFESGGKHFRIDRNFDRYSKKAELVCEDDGEQLSVEDGDLDMLLSGMNLENYENTVSVRQGRAKIGQALAVEVKNQAMNYYTTGDQEIDLKKALGNLGESKKELERKIRISVEEKQKKRERIEMEASYVWRDIHGLEDDRDRIEEELRHRKEKEMEPENKRAIDELRSDKWRIHPFEVVIFVLVIIMAFVLIAKPWNYLVAIIVFLASGIYIWNRVKVGKKQEKTEPEIILEEITPETEKVSKEKLIWEKKHIEEEFREKRVQYENLQEQMEELDEIGGEYREYERHREAIALAMDRLNELSEELQGQLEHRLDDVISGILCEITDGKYTKILIEDGERIRVLGEGRWVPMEQLSRGTMEQIYLAIRLAASALLYDEEYPLVLDDTFVYYDDVRLENTLRWLCKNRRQVVILTCQKREEEILKKMDISYHREEIE